MFTSRGLPVAERNETFNSLFRRCERCSCNWTIKSSCGYTPACYSDFQGFAALNSAEHICFPSLRTVLCNEMDQHSADSTNFSYVAVTLRTIVLLVFREFVSPRELSQVGGKYSRRDWMLLSVNIIEMSLVRNVLHSLSDFFTRFTLKRFERLFFEKMKIWRRRGERKIIICSVG